MLSPIFTKPLKSKVQQQSMPKMPTSHPQNVSKTPGEMAWIVAQGIVAFLIFVLVLLVLLTWICLVIKYFPWFLALGLFMMIVTTPELQQGLEAAAERKKKERETKPTQTLEPALAEHEAHMTPERPIKMSLRSGRLV